ncbi:uncharacterized protein LOC128958306 [Oppia nitens]|uniref:uncharacterized protein LOC128958306 n=1 Tax=Oppia nitens TaxID=1686743 RepID=UPI0023DB4DB0|nr:uncharacterized protein LOC128958306 [Oppia nitens]
MAEKYPPSPSRSHSFRRDSIRSRLASVTSYDSTAQSIPAQTAVERLGSSDLTADIPDKGYEMTMFSMSPTPSRPQSPQWDPMEHQYERVELGESGHSMNIEQDLKVLDELGFIIDYPNGILGAGFFGSVYRGYYGNQSNVERDKRNRRKLKDTKNLNQFAVKFVDFLQAPSITSVFIDEDYIREKREAYEMEKFIMTYANHPNICSIRMTINMGECRSQYYLHDPNAHYLQYDRIYLIMDYADGSSLMNYMNQNAGKLKPYHRIKLTRDSFKGLKYLHDNGIFHGDIHLGNVLIFHENNDLVAKWIDFGLSHVSNAGRYVWNKFSDRDIERGLRKDVSELHSILWNCWRGRKMETELPDETKLCNEVMEMIKFVKRVHTLDEVYQKYRHIIDDSPLVREQLI